MTAYLWITMAGTLAGFLLFGLLMKRGGQPAGTALIALPLSVLMGAALAKVSYVLLVQWDYIFEFGEWEHFLDFEAKRMCFTGGAAGCCAGVILAAKLRRVRLAETLDAFAAPGSLLTAVFRIAEAECGTLGAGAPAEGAGLLSRAPFVITNAYGEKYMAVFFWEAAAALAIMVWALASREKRPGMRFEKTLFALCLCQILLENLRNQAMKWGFVYVEQVLCAVVLFLITIRACRRRGSRKGQVLPAAGVLVSMGLIVAEEFGRQKANSRFLTETGFGWMALILLGIATIYGRVIHSSGKESAKG